MQPLGLRHGLKGCAGCRQTELQADRQTSKQTDDLCLLRQRIGEQADKQTDDLCLLRQRKWQTKSWTYAKNWRTDKQSKECVTHVHLQ